MPSAHGHGDPTCPDSPTGRRPGLSVVVPVYDEEAVLPLFVGRLRPVLDELQIEYEVLVVDDGSGDGTPLVLAREMRDWPELRVVRLRANSGHQAAISAGLARSRGDHVVTIDADLQDPPEVIGEMLRTARREGADVVYGVRSDRSTDATFKRVSARAFYRLIRRLSGTRAQSDAGDFRLMSRATVDALSTLPEYGRVLRFAVPAFGFPSASVGYRREGRAAGRSKYPLARMILLSLDSITGATLAPLRGATLVGLFGGLTAVALLVWALLARLLGHTTPGWTSTVVIVSGVGAIQLLCLGVLGEYVGRVYAQLQARPPYFVAYDSLEAAGRPDADGDRWARSGTRGDDDARGAGPHG